MSSNRHKLLSEIIGFTIANPDFLHLEVPIFFGKPKVVHFIFLADKVKLKLAAWKGSLLTMVC